MSLSVLLKLLILGTIHFGLATAITCYICGQESAIVYPFNIITFTDGSSKYCSTVELEGLIGYYTEEYCYSLGPTVESTCGCEIYKAPTAAPSQFPTEPSTYITPSKTTPSKRTPSKRTPSKTTTGAGAIFVYCLAALAFGAVVVYGTVSCFLCDCCDKESAVDWQVVYRI